MKNIVKLFFCVVVCISIFSLTATVSKALTISEIDNLLKIGSITSTQADLLRQNADVDVQVQTTPTTYSYNYYCADINTNIGYLKKDSAENNNAVSLLQNFLYKNKYLSLTPTGYFGNATLQAVKNFQLANNISATGYVGPLTRAKIKSLGCESVQPTIQNVIPTETSVSIIPNVTLESLPMKVSSGYPVTLKWSSINAVDKCTITSVDSSGKKRSGIIDLSGSKLSDEINIPTTFTVVCYSKYGIPGTASVYVDTFNSQTNTEEIKETPKLDSVTPTSGNRGDVVTIKGTGFLSTNNVYFDGKVIDNSLIKSQSSTTISFIVPQFSQCLSANCLAPIVDTKIETGGDKLIQVSNKNGFSTVVSFTLPYNIITIAGTTTVNSFIQPVLVLSSISTTTGNRGDTVTISGKGFSTDSIVFFDGFIVSKYLIKTKTSEAITFLIPEYQMGCTNPDLESCPRLPLAGSDTLIETGGIKKVWVMNTLSKATTTSDSFTLPSKKIVY